VGYMAESQSVDVRCPSGPSDGISQDVSDNRPIDVRGLSKHYGTVESIRGITFEVARGEFLA